MKNNERSLEKDRANKISRRDALQLGIVGLFAGLSALVIKELPAQTTYSSTNEKSTLGKHENKPNPIIEDFINIVKESYKTESALDPKIISYPNESLIYTGNGKIKPILYTVYNDKEGSVIATYAIYTNNKSGINVNNRDLAKELKLLKVQENVEQLGTSTVNINKEGTLVNQNYIAIGVPTI